MRYAPSPPVILIVEDEILLLEFAADVLEDAGFSVLKASNPAEALRVLATAADVQVLFTDVDLRAERDGIWLARQVKAEWPDVHLIVTSGRSWAAEAPGIFVPKPYSPDQVIGIIRDQIDRRGEWEPVHGESASP